MSTVKSGGVPAPGVMDPHGLHKLLHPVWFGLVHSALIRELRPRSGERVLDVGAGTGVLAERISASGAAVVCIDPDAGSLAAAEKRLAGRGAEFIAAPAESIPLPDASVDSAVVSLSAHHWQDRDEGFGEIARVLRPGGRLVLAEFRPAGPVRSVIRRLGGGKHSGAPGAAAWTASLTRAGFADARVVTGGPASLLALIIYGRKNQEAGEVRQSQAAAADGGEPPAAGGRLWLVLVAMVFGLFMPMLDHLVVNVALPTIQHRLGAGISGLQWIVDAYTLTFAAFMLTGGTLGDRYGRKRFFLAGLVLFSLASALAGMSATTGQQQRRPHALQRPGRDQLPRTGRHPGQRRGQREQGQAGQEEPLAPVAVTERPAGQHERGERERVGVHDPLQPGDPSPQLVLDRGQGHVHHQVIEHRHEQAKHHRGQNKPKAATGDRRAGITAGADHRGAEEPASP